MNNGYFLYFENGATVKDCLCVCHRSTVWYSNFSDTLVFPVVFCLTQTSAAHVATKMSDVRITVFSLLIIHSVGTKESITAAAN